jgi:hypothetical protein
MAFGAIKINRRQRGNAQSLAKGYGEAMARRRLRVGVTSNETAA